MSIFSHIRRSRQQAKEHSAKLAEQEKKEQQTVPYRHVPTHAATDAFASAPPSWREMDRPRILEQNRRRSAMAATGQHINMSGAPPRVGSSLSHVTYPGEDATPTARMPRPNSFCAAGRSRDVVYHVPHISYSRPVSFKGKEVVGKWQACDSQRTSPTPSKGEPSSVESSGGSTGSGSQDDLDMKPIRPSARATYSPHRLHPSHSRRTSEGSIERGVVGKSARGTGPSSHARDHRPLPSMRGFASIAQVTATPPVHPGFLTPRLPSQATIIGRAHAKGSSTSSSSAGSLTPRPISTSSLPAPTPPSSFLPATGPGIPPASTVPQTERSLSWTSALHADLDKSWSLDGSGEAQQKPRDQRIVQTVETSDPEPVNSAGARPICEDATRDRMPPPLAHEDIVNVFPEQASLPEPSTTTDTKKDSKRRAKMLKKSRWPSFKGTAVVV